VQLPSGQTFDVQVSELLDADDVASSLANRGFRAIVGDASRSDDYGEPSTSA
jgi:hypothetical protein